MKHSPKKRIRGAALLAWLFCWGLLPGLRAESVPGISFPAGSNVALALQAEGDQVYEAKADNAGKLIWSLKTPEAQLESLGRVVVGQHGAGPSWTANDGSKIVGQLPPLQMVPGRAPGSIPWLLLAVQSHEGTGIFSDVKYVARLATEGGIAPAEMPKEAAETVRVRYRALYLFLRGS
jgi:Protein of unknown function (DUF3455)